MEVELGQLDLRYGSLSAREKREERQAVSAVSAERAGPVVVVREGERWVVVEGFATVVSLRQACMKRPGHSD